MVKTVMISIYHDALLQHGGAEKVAISWAKNLNCPLVTFARGKHFSWASETVAIVKVPWIQNHKMLQFVFPIIPVILKFIKFDFDDLRLVSTTGLAHYFGGNWRKRVIYMHSPARWIWNHEEIEKDLNPFIRIIMSLLRPLFKKYDLSKLKDNDIVVANSRATAQRIREIYNREAQVIYPPVSDLKLIPNPPENFDLESVFFLSIGRRKTYKGFSEAIEACKLAKVKLVLVGEGSLDLGSENVLGLGFVSAEELAWLYKNAQALIATGSEDFGLTPVEAALHGCPTLAYPRRGYFDSVRHGVSGQIVNETSIQAMSSAISEFAKSDYNENRLKDFADEFSIESHMKKILAAFSEG